jgi:dTMP kinase
MNSLVSCEGIDGSGKSTVINKLSDDDFDSDIIKTAEPTELHSDIHNLVSTDNISDPLFNFFTLLLDRYHHVNEIIENEYDDTSIISDRYVDSTRVYQPIALAGESGPFESLWEAKHYVEIILEAFSYEPDLTIYIDVSVDTALDRIETDHTYENREFLQQARTNYLVLCDQFSRFVRVDGEQDIDSVVNDVTDTLINHGV